MPRSRSHERCGKLAIAVPLRYCEAEMSDKGLQTQAPLCPSLCRDEAGRVDTSPDALQAVLWCVAPHLSAYHSSTIKLLHALPILCESRRPVVCRYRLAIGRRQVKAIRRGLDYRGPNFTAASLNSSRLTRKLKDYTPPHDAGRRLVRFTSS